MFSQLVASVVRSQPLLQFIDVLCQGTSGAPAAALPAAYMVRALSQMYQPGVSTFLLSPSAISVQFLLMPATSMPCYLQLV
jgi:hypothetical protein